MTLKTGLLRDKFGRLVSRANDENKIKTYEKKAILAKVCISNYIPLSWASIHCELKKWKKLMTEFQFQN